MPPKLANLRLHEHAIHLPYNLPGKDGEQIHLDVYIDDTGQAVEEYILCDICNLPIKVMGKHSRSTAGLTNHRDTKGCRKRVSQGIVQSAQRRVVADANAMRERLFRTSAGQASRSQLVVLTMETQLSDALEAQRIARFGEEIRERQPTPPPRPQNQALFDHIYGDVYNPSHPIYSTRTPTRSTPATPRNASTAPIDLPPSSPPAESSLVTPQDVPLHAGDPQPKGDEYWVNHRTPSPDKEPANNPAESDTENTSSDDGGVPRQAHCRRSSQIPGAHCNGQQVKWTAGPIWTTYSYQLHAEAKIPYQLLRVEADNYLVLRSNNCRYGLLHGEEDSGACTRCARLGNSEYLRKLLDRASKDDLPPQTQYKYLSHAQITRLAIRQRAEINRLRLRELNQQRRISNLTSAQKASRKMLIYISQNKIPAVSRILKTCIQRGDSSSTMLNKLVLAACGKLRVREPWSDYELDVANLVRLEGGPRLLYALGKVEGYPSRTTLRRRKRIPELWPSIGIPSEGDVRLNLKEFFGPDGRQPPKDIGIGQALLIDDIALEEVPRYDANRNCVLGLCREHVHSTGVAGCALNSLDNLRKIEAALHAGECHHGKEATVVALAPVTGEDNYFPSPIVVSATCKKEKWEDLADWINTLLKTYNASEHGAARHGPITVIATDGASTFRKARFSLCHREVLDRSSKLGQLLYRLPGLNMRTGPGGVLGTCDFKHVIKRFATWLRSSTGVQVNKSSVTTDHIYQALITLQNKSPADAHALLNPKDKQNVPAAVKLLEALLELNPSISNDTVTMQSILRKVKDIAFVAKLVGFFLLPFIRVKMSLSEQLQSLSTYSHLLTALYRRNGSGFMRGALYADSQAIVKNIFFTAARLQIHNPSGKYHIILDGTDRLETVFGAARTQDHGNNFDILQLAHKLAIGTEINAIFERHPQLSMGHRRLSLAGASGIDHVNPRSWVGDVNLAGVNIEKEYLAGRDAANKLLEEFFEQKEDFTTLFSKPDVDHLRPTGEYIGTSHHDEDVESEDIAATGDSSETILPPVLTPDTGTDDLSELSPADHNNGEGEIDEDNDESEDEEDESDIAARANHHQLNPVSDVTKGRSYLEDEEGKQHSKHTLVAQYLVTSDAARKVASRTFRVRGDTLEGSEHARKRKREQIDKMFSDKEGQVAMGDPGAILVRSGEHISLALAEPLNFRRGANSKVNLQSVAEGDLASPGVSIAVQLMELKPKVLEDGTLRWNWSGEYLQLQPTEEGQPLTQKHFAIRIRGDQFYPIAPNAPSIDGSSDQELQWSFNNPALEAVMEEIYADMNPDSNDIISSLHSLTEVDGLTASLPMRFSLPDMDENAAQGVSLHIQNAPKILKTEQYDRLTNIPCKLCGKNKQLGQMRNHVGHHILRSHRHVADRWLPTGGQVEIGLDPCGWCGLADAGCRTEVKMSTIKGKEKDNEKATIFSTCPYHYAGMNYRSACESTTSSPSTNVPIQCTMCPTNRSGQHPTLWKYNFYQHLVDQHLDSQSSRLIPVEMARRVQVTSKEEGALGIAQEAYRSHRKKFDIPNTSSDAPQPDDYPPEESGSATPHRKRDRGLSDISHLSRASRNPSPIKRSRQVDVSGVVA